MCSKIYAMSQQSEIRVVETPTFSNSYNEFILVHIDPKNSLEPEEKKEKIQKFLEYLSSVLNEIKSNPMNLGKRLRESQYRLEKIPGWIYLKYRDKLNKKTVKNLFHKKAANDKSSRYLRIIYAYNPDKKLIALLLVYTHYQYNDAPKDLLSKAVQDIKSDISRD